MPHRDPWTVTLEAPAPGADLLTLLRHALHAAITAPSPGNSQPWRFLLGDDHVDLFTDPSRALPVRDPEGQQRLIAGGAALGLLRVALRALGLGETTTLLPGDHPDLLARVALTGSVAATPEETWLLQAVPKRRTHRGLLAARPVRERLLERLQNVARDSDAELLVLGSSRQRAALATRGDAVQRARDSDAAWNDERRAWSEPGPDPFEDSNGDPARGPAILEGAPVLALITTTSDDRLAWLRAGEALIRVLLRGRVDHLYASFLHGPLTHAADRWAVAEESAVLGDMPQTPGYAQLALRLGYGSDLPPTPRRPLSEVLLAAPP
ncbi:MAG: hypothetical protein H0T76_08760 [Nannocystis sp.]|nr:hypothetical protein [Nannocystis sp.]MBA3546559.1 hypothetical protein [Nannocystis sp.]